MMHEGWRFFANRPIYGMGVEQNSEAFCCAWRSRRKATAHSRCRCGDYEAVFPDPDLGCFMHYGCATQTAILLRVRGGVEGGDDVGVCDNAVGHVMVPRLPLVGHFYDVAGVNDRHHDLCAHRRNFSDGTRAGEFAGTWHGIAQIALGREQRDTDVHKP